MGTIHLFKQIPPTLLYSPWMVQSLQTADAMAGLELRPESPLRRALPITVVAAIGGFLFGYDTAVISGAIGFIENHFHLTAFQTGWAGSPTNAFAPMVVHYAETFIVPAGVGRYRIRPGETSGSGTCATIRASVRSRFAGVL